MLSVRHIDAGYDEFQVLKSVSLELKPQEVVALIGPNGAGKSTVLKAIFSLSKVTKGTISFNDENITSLKTHELLQRGISFVPQGKINFGTLSVKENLLLGALHINDKEKIEKSLLSVYKQFPVLKKKAHTLAYSLSGGEQQMLALGRALMQHPKVLLLDEPSLGLSPKLVKETFARIKKLSKEEGIAVLMVEQNAKQAIAIADKTYLLENGKVALQGNKEILHHPKIKSIYLGGDVNE